MNDPQVRVALRKQVFRRFEGRSDVVLIEEFGVLHGAGRLDFLLVNGHLHGYEIKSDRDTLFRLTDQVRIFSTALDRMTLVVGFKHADRAIRAIPDWWGIKLVTIGKRGATQVLPARDASLNPMLDSAAVAKLMWKSEALKVLSSLGEAKGLASSPRRQVYARLVEVASLDAIRFHVRECIKQRTTPRVATGQKSDDDLKSPSATPLFRR